jgi:hypothetical protein
MKATVQYFSFIILAHANVLFKKMVTCLIFESHLLCCFEGLSSPLFTVQFLVLICDTFIISTFAGNCFNTTCYLSHPLYLPFVCLDSGWM